MTDLLEEVDTPTADEWAFAEPKQSDKGSLQALVDEFLAQGGRIRTCAPGETAIAPNQPLWSFPVGTAATPDPVKRAQAAARRNAILVKQAHNRPDTVLVAEVDKLLGVAKNAKEIYTALGVGCQLLQRLLHDYFPTDSRADAYRAKNRIDHSIGQAQKIRALLKAGETGIANIARLMKLDRQRIMDLDREFGLSIPRKDGGKVAVPKQVSTKRKYEGKQVCTNAGCAAKLSALCQYCPHCGQITDRGLEKGVEP